MKPYANLHGYSDIHPYEVVASTAKTISVRSMGYKLAEGQKPNIIPGGFAGHCTNQRELVYVFWTEPDMPVIKAYLRKDGHYHSAFGKHVLNDKPVAFYDYNY